jgi:hypothetical protein
MADFDLAIIGGGIGRLQASAGFGLFSRWSLHQIVDALNARA